MANDKLPDTRVNLTYRDALDGAQEEQELPFRLLVVGDFSAGSNREDLEARRPLAVDPYTFDQRMAESDLTLDLSVDDRLTEGEDAGQIGVSLKVRKLEDFEPHRVIDQVEALRKLRDVREALEGLKTAFLNEKDFRRRINELVADASRAEALLAEVKGA
ncbi:MAG: type VI secretion system contractile sheath small subunit [Alphaproteobacteria bacterium]|nr:type VI secretion system contractile sheath small subunit [Alphaproteobacteria bacterium]